VARRGGFDSAHQRLKLAKRSTVIIMIGFKLRGDLSIARAEWRHVFAILMLKVFPAELQVQTQIREHGARCLLVSPIGASKTNEQLGRSQTQAFVDRPIDIVSGRHDFSFLRIAAIRSFGRRRRRKVQGSAWRHSTPSDLVRSL
jgi:hypothetical protein